MPSKLPSFARAAGIILLVVTLCPLGRSQEAESWRPGLDGWKLTGASSVIRNDSTVVLPAGAQLSRVFGSDESLSARIRFDALFAQEPENAVSVQLGRSTIVLTRAGVLGQVFVTKGSEIDEEPLLTVDFGAADGDPVSVDLSTVTSLEGSTVWIEVAGESVDWRTTGTGNGIFEFVLSAGRSAFVRISEFEFLVNRQDRAADENRLGVQTVAAEARSEGVTAASSAIEPKVASAGSGGVSFQSPADKKAEAPAAEPGGGSPPGRAGLEVFTPPSVRRHEPNANANPRAQEVTP